MYKGASQNLQYSHGVGRIMASAEPTDALPDVASLTLEEARAEREQLKVEVQRAEQEIAVAKAIKSRADERAVGQRKAALCARLSLVKDHIRRNDADNEKRRLGQAIREIVPDKAEAIFERARELRKEILGEVG